MTKETRLILERLDEIKSDLDYLKEHIDVDLILTEDDKTSIIEAERDLKEGRTISHEKLKKELGL